MKKKTVKELEILQLVKKKMAMMGFVPNQQKNNLWKINGRQKMCLIWYFNGFIFHTVFILREANAIGEYMESIFLITIIFAATAIFINMIYKNDKLFEAIENCEKEINKSKWKA